jgi:hypothetical protein
MARTAEALRHSDCANLPMKNAQARPVTAPYSENNAVVGLARRNLAAKNRPEVWHRNHKHKHGSPAKTLVSERIPKARQILIAHWNSSTHPQVTFAKWCGVHVFGIKEHEDCQTGEDGGQPRFAHTSASGTILQYGAEVSSTAKLCVHRCRTV